jgi:hypothetical protein
LDCTEGHFCQAGTGCILAQFFSAGKAHNQAPS